MLRKAAALIAEVVETLNSRGRICSECHAMRRESWTEYQAATTLKHLPARLYDQADRLDNATSEIH